MFYIKEIIFRFQYLFISFFSTFLLCYIYRTSLLSFLTYSILIRGVDSGSLGINYFIYTHPSELANTYFLVVFYFTTLITLPYFFWSILDFLKSSLLAVEYFRLRILSILLAMSIILFNFFSFFYLYPNVWFFFESFNRSSDKSNLLNFFLELRIQDYLLFLKSFLHLTNLCLFFLVVAIFLFSFLGLKNLIHWKKLFIVINIVFATLLSPPDVYSQLLVFCILTLNLEIIILCYIIHHKIYKYIKLT